MSHHPESALITQFQLKVVHAILTSRIPSLSDPDPDPNPQPSTQARKRDRWFNLALGHLPDSLLHDLHRHHGLTTDDAILDVILSPDDVIAERWTVACEPRGSTAAADDRRAYKKSIVLLRSLYSILRLLPCFKIFKKLTSSSSLANPYSCDLSYRISSFASPFSREEERSLRHYAFSPIETQFGSLTLSVHYRSSFSDFNFEVSSPISTMIIPDYVGSPIADPMRSFTRSGSRPIPNPNPLRGGGGSVSGSESRSVPIDVYRNRIPSQKAASSSQSNARFSFDEFRLSSPLSNSPTSPVSIPTRAVTSEKRELSLHRNPCQSEPMRSFLPPLSPSSRAGVRMEQNSPSHLSESRGSRRSEGFKLGDFYSNLYMNAAQKGHKDGRDDSGRFSGISSGGSPRFSRSSSRLSIQDDLDDGDFSCPFAVDDVDTVDSQTRNLDGKEVPESSHSYTSSHKSQDAAVGALVHKLRTAAPLRQEHNYSSLSSRSELNGEIGNSSFFDSRKTSDALEELQTYKEMKGILLSQSRTQLLDSETE